LWLLSFFLTHEFNLSPPPFAPCQSVVIGLVFLKHFSPEVHFLPVLLAPFNNQIMFKIGNCALTKKMLPGTVIRNTEFGYIAEPRNAFSPKINKKLSTRCNGDRAPCPFFLLLPNE